MLEEQLESQVFKIRSALETSMTTSQVQATQEKQGLETIIQSISKELEAAEVKIAQQDGKFDTLEQ